MPSRRLKLRYLFLFLILPFEVRAFDRIVTLTPSLSEWTATLLGEAKAKKAIVGVSEFSQYPAYLKSVDLVGPYPKLAVEKIASLKPDLVLASAQANQHDQIEQLRRLRLNVQVLPVEKFSEMAEWIVNLGEILHEKKAAEAVQKEWIRGVNDLKRTQSKAQQTLRPRSSAFAFDRGRKRSFFK